MEISKNFFVLCCIVFLTYSFTKSAPDEVAAIKSFDGSIGMKVFHRQNINDFVITMGEDAGIDGTLTYEPLVVPQKGWAISWRHGSIQLSSQTLRGSRSKHYQFHYYRKNFGAELKHRSYRSFQLKSALQSSNPFWSNRDDLNVESTHLAFYYLPADDVVSFKAGFDQTERQLQSGWSPLVQLTGEKLVVRAGESLIPPASRSRFFMDRGFQGGDFRTFSLLLGVAFTYVPWDAFYFTAAGGLGLGYQWRDYHWGDVGVEKWGLSTKHNFRVGFGYNDDRYYAGALWFTDGDTYKLENSWIENEGGFMTFYVGFRFFPEEVKISDILHLS